MLRQKIKWYVPDINVNTLNMSTKFDLNTV